MIYVLNVTPKSDSQGRMVENTVELMRKITEFYEKNSKDAKGLPVKPWDHILKRMLLGTHSIELHITDMQKANEFFISLEPYAHGSITGKYGE